MICRLLTLLALLATTPLAAQADTLYGDLTADGVEEMLVVVRHPRPLPDAYGDSTVLSSAKVYRWAPGYWERWPAADGPVMHAYDEVDLARFYAYIEKGTLVLSHYKTGYLNWETLRRYRFQHGRFELIGYTHTFTDPCRSNEHFDYNLSTGSWTYQEVEEQCDEEGEPRRRRITKRSGTRRVPLPVISDESLPEFSFGQQ